MLQLGRWIGPGMLATALSIMAISIFTMAPTEAATCQGRDTRPYLFLDFRCYLSHVALRKGAPTESLRHAHDHLREWFRSPAKQTTRTRGDSERKNSETKARAGPSRSGRTVSRVTTMGELTPRSLTKSINDCRCRHNANTAFRWLTRFPDVEEGACRPGEIAERRTACGRNYHPGQHLISERHAQARVGELTSH